MMQLERRLQARYGVVKERPISEACGKGCDKRIEPTLRRLAHAQPQPSYLPKAAWAGATAR